jgi:hypothetical protein
MGETMALSQDTGPYSALGRVRYGVLGFHFRGHGASGRLEIRPALSEARKDWNRTSVLAGRFANLHNKMRAMTRYSVQGRDVITRLERHPDKELVEQHSEIAVDELFRRPRCLSQLMQR